MFPVLVLLEHPQSPVLAAESRQAWAELVTAVLKVIVSFLSLW